MEYRKLLDQEEGSPNTHTSPTDNQGEYVSHFDDGEVQYGQLQNTIVPGGDTLAQNVPSQDNTVEWDTGDHQWDASGTQWDPRDPWTPMSRAKGEIKLEMDVLGDNELEETHLLIPDDDIGGTDLASVPMEMTCQELGAIGQTDYVDGAPVAQQGSHQTIENPKSWHLPPPLYRQTASNKSMSNLQRAMNKLNVVEGGDIPFDNPSKTTTGPPSAPERVSTPAERPDKLYQNTGAKPKHLVMHKPYIMEAIEENVPMNSDFSSDLKRGTHKDPTGNQGVQDHYAPHVKFFDPHETRPTHNVKIEPKNEQQNWDLYRDQSNTRTPYNTPEPHHTRSRSNLRPINDSQQQYRSMDQNPLANAYHSESKNRTRSEPRGISREHSFTVDNTTDGEYMDEIRPHVTPRETLTPIRSGVRSQRSNERSSMQVYRPPSPDYQYASDSQDIIDSQSYRDHDTNSHPVVSPSPSKLDRGGRSLKCGNYDGKTSLRNYLAQFDMIACCNGWQGHIKAAQLAGHLQGAALDVLGDLNMTDRFEYGALVGALKYRFEPPEQNETSRAKLKHRIRRRNESLEELAHAVRRLSREAFQDIPKETLEYFSMMAFIDGLNDGDMEWHVQSTSPKCLNDALTSALKFESFKKGRHRRLYQPTKENDQSTLIVDTNYSMNQINVEEIEAKITKNLENKFHDRKVDDWRPRGNTFGPTSPMVCNLCGERGHIARRCVRCHPNATGGQRACYNCGERDHFLPKCPKPKARGMSKNSNMSKNGY